MRQQFDDKTRGVVERGVLPSRPGEDEGQLCRTPGDEADREDEPTQHQSEGGDQLVGTRRAAVAVHSDAGRDRIRASVSTRAYSARPRMWSTMAECLPTFQSPRPRGRWIS